MSDWRNAGVPDLGDFGAVSGRMERSVAADRRVADGVARRRTLGAGTRAVLVMWG